MCAFYLPSSAPPVLSPTSQLSTNNGYTSEIAAHWISSYFLGDEMLLPGSVEAALAASAREAAWLKQRYPQVPTALNPSYAGFLTFFTYVYPTSARALLIMLCRPW